MKDHEIAQLVNALRDCAVEYRDAQALRDIRPKALTDEALAGNTGNRGGHLTQQMRDHYQRIRLPERSDVTINLPKRKAQ